MLGFQRHAPVQILVMGSPVTSGNPSIDYFVSGDRIEHPFRTHFSQETEHYTEQVILLDGQAISYPSSEISAGAIILDSGEDVVSGMLGRLEGGSAWPTLFNLPNFLADMDSVHLYICPQNLFKIHPSFDRVIESILHADNLGRVVLQAVPNKNKQDLFSNRLLRTFSQQLCSEKEEENNFCASAMEMHSRVHFVDRTSKPLFRFLIQQSNCILHPFPFGGSKTSSDALQLGVPLVTFPQPYLRGRMAAGFFETMAIHEVTEGNITSNDCCVARSVSDYVSKAVRLGVDNVYRQKVSRGIAERSSRIVDDKQVNYEWLRFLYRVLLAGEEGGGGGGATEK